jgi:hypothetical protein
MCSRLQKMGASTAQMTSSTRFNCYRLVNTVKLCRHSIHSLTAACSALWRCLHCRIIGSCERVTCSCCTPRSRACRYANENSKGGGAVLLWLLYDLNTKAGTSWISGLNRRDIILFRRCERKKYLLVQTFHQSY